MPKAYIIARQCDIISKIYHPFVPKNGYHCKNPLLSGRQKRVFTWYTGRDSNPQPSEPESDALSIEPPVHLFSLAIIATFSRFVKGKNKNIPAKNQLFSIENCAIIVENPGFQRKKEGLPWHLTISAPLLAASTVRMW